MEKYLIVVRTIIVNTKIPRLIDSIRRRFVGHVRWQTIHKALYRALDDDVKVVMLGGNFKVPAFHIRHGNPFDTQLGNACKSSKRQTGTMQN